MNILKSKIIWYESLRDRKWKRKLRVLDASRPRLIRSEYLNRLIDMGYKLKDIKIIYNVINEYISSDEFSMYPEDDIQNYYLREKSDLAELIEKIYKKLKIIRKDNKNIILINIPSEPLTVGTILNMIKNARAK